MTGGGNAGGNGCRAAFWKGFRLFLLLALAPLIGAFFVEAVRNWAQVIDLPKVLWIFYGAAAFALVAPLVFLREPDPNRPPTLWETLTVLEHELAHLASGILLGRRTWKVVVQPKGDPAGVTDVQVPYRPAFVVFLAPYLPPLLAVALLLVEALAPSPYNRFAAAAIGFVFAFRLIGLFRFLHADQSDLKKMGYLFSYSLVPIVNAVFFFLILGSVSDRWIEMWRVLLRAFDRGREWYAALYELWRQAGR
jgi:hypothetical protein